MQKGLFHRPVVILYAAAGFIFLVLVVNLAFLALVKDPASRTAFSDILPAVLDLLSAAALIFAARRSAVHSSRMGFAWAVLAAAVLVYAVGDIIWMVLEVGLGRSPFPSAADIFYLAFYLIFLVGVLLLPMKALNTGEWLKRALDMGVVMLAAILGFWNFFIAPLATASPGQSTLGQLLSMAYPAGDLVLVWALLMLLYYRAENQSGGSVLLLAASTCVLILTDCSFSYQSFLGIYVSGGYVDLGWILAFSLTGLAGLWQGLSAQPGQKTIPILPFSTRLSGLTWLLNYLPYAWLLLAYAILARSYYHPSSMGFAQLALGVGVIIALVIIRQVLTLRENDRLLGQLQQAIGQVQLQAADLEKTNRVLQIEVAERKHAEEQLAYDVLHDMLTGLPNRTLFVDRLERAIEYTRRRADCPFSVLFLDLDYFKVINDSLGHSVGDRLLISIARRLEDCLRASDTVARLGGDEFVILLDNTLQDNAVILVANRIQEELRKVFIISGHNIYITTSIGIVPSVQGYERPEDLMRDADLAMYHAKAQGKARSEIFNANMRTQAISRLELENELRHALEHGEFLLHYQPIVDLRSSRIIGFEALLRWQHPRRGLLPPAEFLTIAEESGLILPIGHWVLHEACSQVKKWQQNFSQMNNMTINVNIAGKQFAQPDFVEQIQNVLAETGLSPESLKLEIIESVLIDNYAAANGKFSRLNEIGVQLEIDDFGTGYSSLGYLQHFPIHTIKIDRSFVKEMGGGNKASELVRAMVSMAHELGMDTTAEGVETEEQLNELKNLTCQYGQGYLLSRPVAPLSVERLLVDSINQGFRLPAHPADGAAPLY
jgi:diguanylate cyclase (GGDEF)-like protein